MGAIASQAELLDKLMGKNRNNLITEESYLPDFQDAEVCKFFLCGFCPNELFTNTRADLGPCDLIHNERLQEVYIKSTSYQKLGYEEEFMIYLNRLIMDVERRIKRGHERLNVNSTVANPYGFGKDERRKRIESITEEIGNIVKQAEYFGTLGNVITATEILRRGDELKIQRALLEREELNPAPQTKELEVCDVCGAFRIKDDAPQRVNEHLIGKMHLGYSQIRTFIKEWEDKHGKPVLLNRPTSSNYRVGYYRGRSREREVVGFKRRSSSKESFSSRRSSSSESNRCHRRHKKSKRRSRHKRKHRSHKKRRRNRRSPSAESSSNSHGSTSRSRGSSCSKRKKSSPIIIIKE